MAQQNLTNVFTYGSLMYPEVIGKLVKETYPSEKALLRDFQRRHVKNAVYPGVTKCPGKQVMGVVYYGVNEEDLAALDQFESQEYEKVNVEVVTLEGKKVKGIVYCYINASNLQNSQWRIEDFEQNHKYSFAQSHSQSRENREQNTFQKTTAYNQQSLIQSNILQNIQVSEQVMF